MIPLTLAQVAQITGGTLAGADASTVIDGPVVTDARECAPGSLYVARVGERADGLAYVSQALERGARAVLADRPASDLATVVVGDVQTALAALAHAVVGRVESLSIVAVTGSSGKTSTKDLLAQVLAHLGPTVAARESLNGEVGVPLTALRVEESTRYLIVEMGARGVGHIDYLTRITPPTVCVVLNVGSAHLGEFGSVEAIARAKAEIVQALAPDGCAVLNADDPLVRRMAEQTPARVVLVGRASDAAVRADDIVLDGDSRASFTLSADQQQAPVSLALHGEHQVGNALAAAAVAIELGLSVPQVAQALTAARPASRWRMEVIDRPDGVRVVNDAYNANPDSMRAALKSLAVMGSGRRTWAVLGEMLELGPTAPAAHEEMGRLAVQLGISRLVSVGAGALPIHTGAAAAGSQAVHVPDVEAAFALLSDELRPGDVVLLKSSRDAGLRHLGDRLVGGQVSA